MQQIAHFWKFQHVIPKLLIYDLFNDTVSILS